MDRLAANLAALPEEWRKLAAALKSAGPPAGAELIPTRDGDWTLRLSRPDGTATTLHSRYAPRAEAEKLVGQLREAETSGGFLVLGFGMGYHLQALAEKCGPNAEILVVERFPEVIRAAAERRDLRALFADRRFFWLVGGSQQEVYHLLRLRQESLLSCATVRIVDHTPSRLLDPEYYDRARTAIRDFALSGRVTMGTHFALAHKSFRNQMENLPWYAGSASLAELRELYAGRPGIVVSAGPSLRRNIEGLKAARGKAVLVACDVVLKPLLARGIVPDFVGVVDYQENTKKFFEGLPGAVPTRLVATAAAYHPTIRMYAGPLAFAGDPLVDRLLGPAGRAMGGMHAGGNVGHFCYAVAGHLGLNPVAFVGQDLGYPCNVTHLPGTPIHEEWQSERNRFHTLEMRELDVLLRRRQDLALVPAQDGGEIFTPGNMYHYLRELELHIKSLAGRVRTVDCTEGGTLKSGAEPVPLAAFLEGLPARADAPAPGAGPRGLDRGRLAAAGEALGDRLLEFLELKAAIEQKLRTHRRIEKALQEGSDTERYLRTLGELEHRARRHPEMLGVLQALTPRAFFAAAKTDRRLGAAETGEDAAIFAERFRRDDRLVRALVESLEFMEPVLRAARRACESLAAGGSGEAAA